MKKTLMTRLLALVLALLSLAILPCALAEDVETEEEEEIVELTPPVYTHAMEEPAEYVLGDTSTMTPVPILGIYKTFTISTWLNMHDLVDGWSGIYTTDGWGDGAVHIDVRPPAYKFNIEVANVVMRYTSKFTFREHTNEWVHIALTYDKAAGNCRFYVNGKLDNIASYCNPDTPTNAQFSMAHLGGFLEPDGVTLSRAFDGHLYRFQVYDRVLTKDEIKAEAELVPPAVGVAVEAAN